MTRAAEAHADAHVDAASAAEDAANNRVASAAEHELKMLREAKTQKLTEEVEAPKLIEEAEAKAHKERDHQQARALLVTLHKLQGTMGPLIAVQVYNSHFCPLVSRLRDELLLCIFDFLCDDVVALHCLRSVSRTFRRILNRRSIIWRDEWYRPCSSPISGDAFYLRDIYSQRFRRLLQRDGRCNDCRRWNDAHSSLFSEDCKLSHSDGQWTSANFAPINCFNITWANIEAHMEKWRQSFEGPLWDWQGIRDQWQRCFDNFNIKCHDPSNDTCCTTSEAPTWPQARLKMSTFKSDFFVVLNLQWRPHSRIDALALTADG
ncbi:predicted protein [Pyrenophora tritici-repentis Pt-1C-BFP]|uniref:F-box domain-containing protein n=1 Tax=Pyrenophora tritici-repentis (strain Pt-1C-BFP) TaxID=426418 RepID=B2WLT3_PYRTR|nr:uncharacterized protein PTRG_10943 [Pyrenophora tritici-repentis Pt-1C-BFP]EDU43993.1 predicted protein [Pyrenophora tritici-repentis Pt-1C-BFP]